jgi:glycosyltransferase involved in cell wall biosynthesis
MSNNEENKEKTGIKKLSSISFFCPAYYDAENLPVLIERAVSLFERIADKYAITIVEDGSPDDTGKIADELAAKNPNIKVVHHPENRGYGGAMKTGFETAVSFGYDYICYTDGDNQYDVREYENFVSALEKSDVVIGYKTNRADKATRKIQSKVFLNLVRTLYGIKVPDINCSMKIFHKSVLESINVESDSAFIDAELIIKAHQLGQNIEKIPVKHYPRIHGKASGHKPKVIWDTFKDCFKIWWRMKVLGKESKPASKPA